MNAPADLRALQPQAVWSHFATLCEIPRASRCEAALRAHLVAWAQARGITAIVDEAGNLILKKPASPGCESLPGVILQGHLDMVCQANAGTRHDFARDAIAAVVRDGWVMAEQTTLGADNGIGVALALAALEVPDWIHPPLEVLLTVNEESGMDGARGLLPGTLQGTTLINLDTEEWGHFYLGCAGGVDVEVRSRHGGAEPSGAGASASHLLPQTADSVGNESEVRSRHGGAEPSGACRSGFNPTAHSRAEARPTVGNVSEVRHDCAQQAVPPGYVLLRFEVTGLRGGHSGIDIQLGRGNAIKLLAEALHDLAAHTDFRLLEMQGGTARNAIPREAFAVCALPAAAVPGIDEWVAHRQAAWQQRFAVEDPAVAFRYELDDTPANGAVPEAERDRLLAFLDTALNGVARMSEDFPGVTDTSSNLGVLSLQQGVLKVTFKVRSLRDASADALADKLISFAASYGLRAWREGAYPGWTPNPDSALLARCQQVYAAQFGQPAHLQVIHAGLECGLLAASHPQLEMISFGPDIRGAHAPGERVEIESVVRCWQLLRAVLQELAEPEKRV
ncbi:M20/M25/M40 family metallo-hydrolase [Ferrigenium sp. UT5]|uniref:M20/M25/M40 family metallo-hydrolase n=1 Tax=Ferrigenium sp. UT5 TaxID=3242105 RepID=UPI0035536481